MNEPYRITLLEILNVFLKYEFPFGLNPCLLPDGMLREKFICGRKSRIMEHTRVALQHVSNSRP